MQLSEVECLAADYTKNDAIEIAAVMQSTVLVTPSSQLRWGNCEPSEIQAWMRKACTSSLASEFKQPRISTMDRQATIPTKSYAEHLVIRDLDLEHLEPDEDHSVKGRIVAHADWKYAPSMGDDIEIAPVNSTDSSMAFPAGFNRDLHTVANKMIVKTIFEVFRGLPSFNLEGISTLTPSHVRKGIAKRLTEWVFPLSDHYAMPVILASSPSGLPLYQKCGFEEYRQYDIIIDLTKYGGEGEHRHVIMVRWPQDLERMPGVWKDWRNAHHSTEAD